MRFESLRGFGSLMTDTIRGSEFEIRLKEHTCVMVWDEVVGDQVSSAAQPEFVRDGVLFVVTKSSVWSNELTFYKADMISRLNRRVGGNVLKDIVFKVGKLKRKKKPAASENNDRPNLEGINLTADEIKEIETIAKTAGPEVSETIKKLMITSAKLEKWKKANGWSPCSKCGSLQRSPEGLCPVCENGK